MDPDPYILKETEKALMPPYKSGTNGYKEFTEKLARANITYKEGDRIWIPDGTPGIFYNSNAIDAATVEFPEGITKLSGDNLSIRIRFDRGRIGIIRSTEGSQFSVTISGTEKTIVVPFWTLRKIVPKVQQKPIRCAILGGKRRQTRKRSRKSKRRIRR